MKMMKHKKYSIRLHWATLLCFLLPFFYTGCGKSKEEMEESENRMADSVKLEDSSSKVNQDSLLLKDSNNVLLSTNSLTEKTSPQKTDTTR